MKLFNSKLFKIYQNSNLNLIRNQSRLIEKLISDKNGSLALVSLSNNIYYNLALENYIAETTDLKNKNILLLWISEPCIVFGRHQNPWLEINVKEAESRLVKIARRYSGGGCVYHDLGNLNISFITDRLRYDRKFNLTVIKDTLDKCNFNDVQFEITPRHDIFVKTLNNLDESFKISGSAARLAQKYSYHHCTLLFDANVNNMKLLSSNLKDRINTKATPSVRSKVTNLKKYLHNKNLDLNEIIIKLCQQFWSLNSTNWSGEYLFNYINPEDDEYFGLLEKSLKELQSWDYIYGTTPKFDLDIDLDQNNKLILTIKNGEIKEYKLSTSDDSKIINDENLIKGLNLLIDTKLEKQSLANSFSRHDFFNLNINFIHLYEFLNKNFN